MSLPGALWLTSAVWSLLLLGAASAPWLGREEANLAACLLATLLVVFVDGRRCTRRAALHAARGLAVGLASWPAWWALLDAVVTSLGLAWPRPEPATSPGWLAAILLAPVFEELLYREHLLAAFSARIGPALALVLSSLLFALPHASPAAMVATFLVGLALGTLRLACDGVAPCVGLHAGLNVGAWLGAGSG